LPIDGAIRPTPYRNGAPSRRDAPSAASRDRLADRLAGLIAVHAAV
jgi:hypothetical protein